MFGDSVVRVRRVCHEQVPHDTLFVYVTPPGRDCLGRVDMLIQLSQFKIASADPVGPD